MWLFGLDVSDITAGIISSVVGPATAPVDRLSLVDALVQRIRSEVKLTPNAIAAGGLGPLIAPESSTIEGCACDQLLTHKGRHILHERPRT